MQPESAKAPSLIYAYFAVLLALTTSAEKLAATPLKHVYKDLLHLTAGQTALLVAATTVPGYFAFAFGLIRDRVNPLRQGDRGYLILGGLGAMGLFLVLSMAPLSVAVIGSGIFAVVAVQTLLRAAGQALMQNVASVRLMTGRISTTYQVMAAAVPLVATSLGGWLTDHHVSWRTILAMVALGYGLVGLFGIWKPSFLFSELPPHHENSYADFGLQLKRLAKRRAFWIAALIWGVWAFSPGANTPVYYFMTSQLGMSHAQYSLYDGLTTFTLFPTVLLFGILVRRYSLWSLVVLSTAIAIPQMIPLMLIHNAPQAYAAAVFMGLTGGLANAAFWTLVLRASPSAMAGTGMLMAVSFGHLAVNGSDILGGWLLPRYGFAGCAWLTTLVYLGLIPLVLLYPRKLMEAKDDEEVEATSGEVSAVASRKKTI